MTVTHPGKRRIPKAAKTSSVFKKVVMALSGIVMLLYLIAHMIGNLKVFGGREAFNHYSEWIRTIGEPAVPAQTTLNIIRIVLLAAVFAHMWAAFALWKQARNARPERYVTKKPVAQSYASRTMRWGGVIVLAFVIYHILDLTVGVANPDGTGTTPYDRLVAGFSNPIVVAAYAISLILLGMHLRHGVWSAAQTLGLTNTTAARARWNLAGYAVAAVVAGGFALVPLSILLGIIE